MERETTSLGRKRGAKPRESRIAVTVSLTQRTIDKLSALATEYGLSYSAVVNQAVARFFQSESAILRNFRRKLTPASRKAKGPKNGSHNS